MIFEPKQDEGGPIPTQLKFLHTDDFELIGNPDEKGRPFTYYDSLYEMNITWYSYEVGFLQKVGLHKPRSTSIAKSYLWLAIKTNVYR